MSMTKKEAIKILEHLAKIISSGDYQETFKMAASALRSITREQVEKVRGEIVETVEKGRMKRVFSCCGCDFTSLTCWITPKFCPSCGAPITDKAVDMVMERLEAVQNADTGSV